MNYYQHLITILEHFQVEVTRKSNNFPKDVIGQSVREHLLVYLLSWYVVPVQSAT